METERDVLTGEIAQSPGDITALHVRLKLGVIKTTLSAGAGNGLAASGDYRTAPDYPLQVEYTVEGRTGHLTIRQRDERDWSSGWWFEFGAPRLNLRFTTAVPVSFDVALGIGQATFDLSDLTVESLAVDGGVGKLSITLPRRGSPDVQINGGVGQISVRRPTDTADLRPKAISVQGGVGSIDLELPGRGAYPVEVETGIGSLTVDVPDSLAALVEQRGGTFLSRLKVRRPGLTYLGDDRWQTAGYNPEAADCARIRVEAGIGSVTIQ